jgi:hypothetical protein
VTVAAIEVHRSLPASEFKFTCRPDGTSGLVGLTHDQHQRRQDHVAQPQFQEASPATTRFGASAVEDPPTEVVASLLVFEHQLADPGGQLGPLPCAFGATIDRGPTSDSSSPDGLDCVRGGAAIVLGCG